MSDKNKKGKGYPSTEDFKNLPPIKESKPMPPVKPPKKKNWS